MSAGASETGSHASGKSSTPSHSGGGGASSSTTTEFEPPLACVRRLLKNSLPSCNVGKDASSAFARACGIFVIYLTACANDFARESKRQTITANDIMAAVTELEFDEFTPQLKAFLEQHRAEERKKKREKDAKKLQAAEQAELAQAQAESAVTVGEEGVQDDGGNNGHGAGKHGVESDAEGAESSRKKLKPNPEGKSDAPEGNEATNDNSSSPIAESNREGGTSVTGKSAETLAKETVPDANSEAAK
uniref:Transcription factor CBF/NF-Y/archaeal histone domain-containing protein n=1 Tax=Pseudictyota dubia TaxID=2749911 RepID=A0A7R9ZCW9_9STRA|mmetsp:Transcript_39080/g.72191  ORF Transcript_39080/g.72191 Transcript_39080/m.72191 type:complete len:247 (+) Transcript_39080:29-769(+)